MASQIMFETSDLGISDPEAVLGKSYNEASSQNPAPPKGSRGLDRVPRGEPCHAPPTCRSACNEKAAHREILGSKSHWSPQTPARESERFPRDRGSLAGAMNREVRTEEAR